MNHLLKSGVMLLMLYTSHLYAGSIKGLIADQETNESVSYASIALTKTGQTDAFAGSISNEDGFFILENIPNGNYSATISFIGYKTKEIHNISISGKTSHVDLNNITLEANAVGLETVEVSAAASTSVKKIDRQTYRADDFETAKGGTAIDVLNKLPSVSVDGDGGVSVRGTSDFIVYLNGKATVTDASTLLSQIPSDNIQNIDVITVPTSKYDAQGKGGIININTKRSTQQGFSLTVNAMGGGTPWSNSTDLYSGQQIDNNRYSTGFNLSQNKGRLAFNASFNYSSRHNNGIGDISPYIYQKPGEASHYEGQYYVLNGIGNRPKWYENLSSSAGLSYQLNDKSDVSATYQYSKRKSGRAAHYNYDTYYANTPTGTPIAGTEQSIYNPNDINRNGSFNNLNLDYNLKISEHTKLNTSFVYESSNLEQTIDNKEFENTGEKQYYDYYNNETDHYETPIFHSYQSDETPLNAYRLAINYETKLQNGNKIETGIQAQMVDLDGIFRYDTIIGNEYYGDVESYDNDINMTRNIYAAYFDYSGTYDKISYILGLRMEYLDQQMDVASTDYFEYVYGYFGDIGNGRDFDEKNFSQSKLDFFPTLHINYKADDINNISLAASRRINRPPAKDMAPFLYRRHQEIYEMGDPLLEPEYIISAELNYTRNFGKNNVTLTGFYRGVNNAIYRVNRVAYDMGNPGGVLLRSYTNSGNQQALGAELGLNLDLLDQVKLYMGGSLYDFRVEADEGLLGDSRKSQSTNWSIKSNLVWNIIKPLKFTVDYSITSGTVTPQGENNEFQMLNIAFNCQPQNLKGWSFSAKVLDVLGTNQSGGYTAAYENGQEQFRRDYVYDYQGQIVELGINYTFNHKKSKKSKGLIGDDYF